MADHFFGITRGLDGTTFTKDISKGSSAASPAADMELRIADAKNLTRQDVAKFLEALENLFEMPGSAPDGTNFPIL
jgi:hypothetical protein